MPFPTYSTYDVMNLVPTKQYDPTPMNNFVVVGSIFLPRRKYAHKPQQDKLTYEYTFESLSAQDDFREFFRDKKGRTNPFWLISYRRDAKFYADAGIGAATINIWPDNMLLELGVVTRHIYIPREDDYHKITNYTVNTGYITLTISPVLSAGVFAEDIIHSLYFCRCLYDVLAMDKIAPNIYASKMEFIELQAETP